MSHLFFDTNVIIDFLSDRKPFTDTAKQLFNYAEKKKIKIYVSTLSFTTIAYLLRKIYSQKEIIKTLIELDELVEAIDLTKSVITASLKSDFNDLEDAAQYHCAVSNKKIEAIVTCNQRDFRRSEIPVLSPEEALSLIENSVL